MGIFCSGTLFNAYENLVGYRKQTQEISQQMFNRNKRFKKMKYHKNIILPLR